MIPDEDKIILSRTDIENKIKDLLTTAQNIASAESDSWKYWRYIGMVNALQDILNGEE